MGGGASKQEIIAMPTKHKEKPRSHYNNDEASFIFEGPKGVTGDQERDGVCFHGSSP